MRVPLHLKHNLIEIYLSGSINAKTSSTEDPSTSASPSGDPKDSLSTSKALEMAKKLLEEQSAYSRFAEDISFEEDDHLDFPLVDEERLLIEYISVLGM